VGKKKKTMPKCEGCNAKHKAEEMTYFDGMYTCKKCQGEFDELVKEAEALIMTDGKPIRWDDVHDGLASVYNELGTANHEFDDMALLYAVFNMGRRFERELPE
jgi:hypothetical protein